MLDNQYYSPDPCPMSKEYYLKLLKDDGSEVIVAEDKGLLFFDGVVNN